MLLGEYMIPDEYIDILGTFKTGTIKMVRKAVKNHDISGLKEGVLKYNKGLVELRQKNVFSQNRISNKPASIEIIEHIMEQSYARIVAPKTNSLRKYEGNSLRNNRRIF
jgi:hypothetical protein